MERGNSVPQLPCTVHSEAPRGVRGSSTGIILSWGNQTPQSSTVFYQFVCSACQQLHLREALQIPHCGPAEKQAQDLSIESCWLFLFKMHPGTLSPTPYPQSTLWTELLIDDSNCEWLLLYPLLWAAEQIARIHCRVNEYLQSTCHKTGAFRAGLPFPKIQYCSNLFFRWRAKLILISSLTKSDTSADFGSQILIYSVRLQKQLCRNWLIVSHCAADSTVLLLAAGGWDRLNPLLHRATPDGFAACLLQARAPLLLTGDSVRPPSRTTTACVRKRATASAEPQDARWSTLYAPHPFCPTSTWPVQVVVQS